MKPTHRHSLSSFWGLSRALLGGLVLLICLALVTSSSAAPTGQPVRVGSTLALTGPLAATAGIHKIVGEIYVEQLNKKNGLLGRPVEWVLLDDQSKPDLTRALYDRLITVDKVDLILGPYATASILSAMAVAERYQKLLIHHTFGLPHLAKYEMHFPSWPQGPELSRTIPGVVFDALASTATPPKTVAVLTSKFPSLHFISQGAREVAAKRGLKEIIYLEYEFGNRDFGAIAARVKEVNPDFIWVGATSLDANMLLEAFKKLEYAPRRHFYLYPAPGPLAVAPEGQGALAISIFEEHPPFTASPVAGEFVKLYHERAAKAGLPYQLVDSQAAASFAAWQILETAITATGTLDDKTLGRWIKANRVETIVGRHRFDGPYNYGDELSKVKQVQGGKWLVVWPKEFAAPGTKLLAP